jgi:Fe2+ or Zn2+ uptake regulation protein
MSHHLETARSLRQQGYRLTPQRLAVLEVIKAGPGHMSVNDVLAGVRTQYPTLTVPTVYRILQWLKGVNLVAETDLGGGCHIYEYIADHHHHHLLTLSALRCVNSMALFPVWSMLDCSASAPSARIVRGAQRKDRHRRKHESPA